MAKRIQKAKGKFPKRPRRKQRQTEYTLQELKEIVAKYGVEQLTGKELKQLQAFQKAASEQKPKEPQTKNVTQLEKPSIRDRLAELEHEVLDNYLAEVRNGTGIARIQALDRIADWAKQCGAWDQSDESIEICFDDDAASNIVKFDKAKKALECDSDSQQQTISETS